MLERLLKLVLVLGAALAVTSCFLLGAAEDTVRLSVSADEHTRVEVSPGGGSVGPDGNRIFRFSKNTQVSLAAEGVDGGEFVGWTGDRDSSSATLSFIIDRDMTVAAVGTEAASAE
jgi:hypothetical protein